MPWFWRKGKKLTTTNKKLLLLVSGMEHFSRLGTEDEFDFLYERSRVVEKPSVSGASPGPSTGHEVISGDTEDVDEVRWSENILEYRFFDGELSPATEVLELDASEGSVVYSTEGEPPFFNGDVEAEVSGLYTHLNEVLGALNDYAEAQDSGITEGEAANYLDEVESALEEDRGVREQPVAVDASDCLDALQGTLRQVREEVKDDMY
jgi:hypothetical protein